jgi:pimeloyl-ACP methyl ester carboxylesterase
MSRLAAPLLGTRPVVIPDLPGHGESDPPEIPAGPSIIECAGAALGTLGALGITQPVLAGQGSGAWVALETLRHGSFHRPRLALMDVPYLPATLRAAFREHGLPSMEPQWHGGHLLLAWHMLRDGRLFFPWFERTRARALRVAPDLDPQRLHLELRELLKASGSWQNLLRDALDYPAQAALRAAAPHILLAAAAASPWQAATREAANAAPALRLAALPAEPADWLPEVLRAWG